MSDPVREAFEAWHLSKFRYCSSFRKGERYADNLTQARWDDWLAACRAARAAALEEAAATVAAMIISPTDIILCADTIDEAAARIRAMVKP